MTISVAVEDSKRTQADWLRTLEIAPSEFSQLIDAKILRKNLGEDLYKLTFVGVVLFSNRIFYSQPKFAPQATLSLSETLRILRGYFASNLARTPIVDSLRDPEYGNSAVLREFDILIELLGWFHRNGLYHHEQVQTGRTGKPHWGRTIAQLQPLLIQDSAIYPHVIAEQRSAMMNEISALQAGLLVQLLERYSLPVPSALRNAFLATGRIIDSWPLSNEKRAYYSRKLAIERRSVFRTDTLHLFTLLDAVLDANKGAPTKPLQIFGTTAFYSVWEDACRTAVAGLTPAESAPMLGQPTWYITESAGVKLAADHSQFPDIVVRRDAWLYIMDAKYYYPFPTSRPGGPDIIKQVYYAESLRDSNANVRSIFLLPLPGADIARFLGYATITGSPRPFATTEAWGIDPAFVFAEYPSASPRRSDPIFSRIMSGRSNVAEFISQPPTGVSG